MLPIFFCRLFPGLSFRLAQVTPPRSQCGGQGSTLCSTKNLLQQKTYRHSFKLVKLVHVDIPHEPCYLHVAHPQEPAKITRKTKLDLLQGTLDLMVLRTLATMGSLHGFGIARRIEQISGDHVVINQGTIYTSLVRLEHRGWIKAKWGISDNNRRARFYSITKAGEKELAAETANWERVSAMIGRVLADEGAES